MALFKQYHTGVLLGALYSEFTTSMGYYNLINSVFIALMAWNMPTVMNLRERMAWLSFPLFIGMLLAIIILIMLIDYKFFLPSRQEFSNQQWIKHKNPMVRQLERIERRQMRIEQALGLKEIEPID